MEYTPKSTLESKFFQIPIEQYEKDIDAGPMKENKKEILDLFTNSNYLHCEEEYKEVEYKLHLLCREGDIELIKIYLSETLETDSQDMTFKIDRTNKTASLFKINKNISQITIPRTIKLESTDFLITSICGPLPDITIVKFVEDSAVKTIYRSAFTDLYPYIIAFIEEIYLPASLTDLKEGWCHGTSGLKKITVSPLNKYFMMIEDKYLVGKSDESKDDFDVLLFARRDIEEISIPSNIRMISSHAFENCSDLARIDIASDSRLETIGEYAFYKTQISEFYLPASLEKLCERWNDGIKNLRKITVSPLNKHFAMIEDKCVVGKSDESKDDFDVLLFARRDIEEISIPSNIRMISSHAFENCSDLARIDIASDSKLETIGEHAFSSSGIKEIYLPSKVSKICEYTFSDCQSLTKIDIPANSCLQTIETGAFNYSKIEEIYLPASLKELKDRWCQNTENLTKITISPANDHFILKEDKYLLKKSDQSNGEFDALVFACRGIKEIIIPSQVSIICRDSFSYCTSLARVEFTANSNLKRIEAFAFAHSGIKEITIPSNVTEISGYAFCYCEDLRKVEFAANSNLQTIGIEAFSHARIAEISIPSTVTKIGNNAFSFCRKLKYFNIPENSNLQTIGLNIFIYTKIKEIYLPASLKELEDGWCYNADKLKKITVSPLNKHFMMIEDKYVVGKSDESKDEFDILLFAQRDIEEISIPSSIRIISSYAFKNCKKLTKVEISSDSKLETIGEYAFYKTQIKEIYLPSKVTIICENAFSECEKLKKIEFAENSNLKIIESSAFSGVLIKKITIPSQVIKICDSVFYDCSNLKKVEFEENSNLQRIDSCAFSDLSIEEIIIPSSVSRICDSAFSSCANLRKVETLENSKLQTIESYAFVHSRVEEISLPASLIELKEKWCYDTENLKKITVSPLNKHFMMIEDKYLVGKSDENKEEFDVLLFARRDIEEISIPSNITKISSYAFEKCTKLTKVEISADSKLETIGEYAFYKSQINRFCLPPNVSKICKYAFSDCTKLTRVEIPPNSNLHKIGECAFHTTKIEEIYLPGKLSKICKYAFSNVYSIKIIEISEKSKFELFFKSFFNLKPVIMVPPH